VRADFLTSRDGNLPPDVEKELRSSYRSALAFLALFIAALVAGFAVLLH
jgi:hypothetical protein